MIKNEEISVEVVFDNSHQKIAIAKQRISFKRVWTIDNKDEYILNNNKMMIKDVEDFFDIFGINRNNPYNIVH